MDRGRSDRARGAVPSRRPWGPTLGPRALDAARRGCRRLEPGQARRRIRYLADEELSLRSGGEQQGVPREFRTAREMPQWASRLTLEITGVRLEQVQAISSEDLVAEGGTWREGAPVPSPEADREGFAQWWSAVNAARGTTWERNPWVWVIEFRRADGD